LLLNPRKPQLQEPGRHEEEYSSLHTLIDTLKQTFVTVKGSQEAYSAITRVCRVLLLLTDITQGEQSPGFSSFFAHFFGLSLPA
jgi:hypothetical protein